MNELNKIELLKQLKLKYDLKNYLIYNLYQYAGNKYMENHVLTLESGTELVLDRDVKLRNGYTYPKGFKFRFRYTFINTDIIWEKLHTEPIIFMEHAHLGTVFIFRNFIYLEYISPFMINGKPCIPTNIPLLISTLKLNSNTEIHPNLVREFNNIMKINKNIKSNLILVN